MARKYGVNNRRRFSIKMPDGTIHSYGTCDERDENDNRCIEQRPEGFALVDLDDSEWQVLPEGTLAANGFYEHERDEWVTLDEFVKQ